MPTRQMTAEELKQALDSGAKLKLLDVREPWEFEHAHLPGSTLLPLGELVDRHEELDPEEPLVVICHHGVRSMHAIGLLGAYGFKDLTNLRGGIDAYSDVDPSIPRY